MVVLKISLLFFCFSSFRDFFIFFPSGGKCYIAEQIEDLLVMYIFGGWAGLFKSNTLLISSLPLNLAFQH